MDCCNYMQHRQSYYGSQYYENSPVYHHDFHHQQYNTDMQQYGPPNWGFAASCSDYVYSPKEARIRKALRDRERFATNTTTTRTRRSNWSRQSPVPPMPPITHSDPRMNGPKDFRSVIRHELENGILTNSGGYMYPSQQYLFSPQSEYLSYINSIPVTHWPQGPYNMQNNNMAQQQAWNQYQADRMRAQQNQDSGYVLNVQAQSIDYSQVDHMPPNDVRMDQSVSKIDLHQNISSSSVTNVASYMNMPNEMNSPRPNPVPLNIENSMPVSMPNSEENISPIVVPSSTANDMTNQVVTSLSSPSSAKVDTSSKQHINTVSNSIDISNVQNIPNMPNVPNVSTIPNVSNVSNIPNVSNITNVPNVQNVQNVSNVPNVQNVSQVSNVSNVSNVQNVPNVSNNISSYESLNIDNSMEDTGSAFGGMPMYNGDGIQHHNMSTQDVGKSNQLNDVYKKQKPKNSLPDFNQAFGSTERGRFQSPPDPRLGPEKEYLEYFIDNYSIKQEQCNKWTEMANSFISANFSSSY